MTVGTVGKIRKQFLERTISSPGLGLLRAVKQYLDPQNIFGSGNLMMPDARLWTTNTYKTWNSHSRTWKSLPRHGITSVITNNGSPKGRQITIQWGLGSGKAPTDFYSGAFWASQKASSENDYEDFLSQNTNSPMYSKKRNIPITIVMA